MREWAQLKVAIIRHHRKIRPGGPGSTVIANDEHTNHMSDATDDMEFLDEQLRRRSQENPLREMMRAYLEDREPTEDPKALRRRLRDGTPLSDLVIQGREERL